MKNKFSCVLSFACVMAGVIGVAYSSDTDNPYDVKVNTPFSEMTDQTYEGYPLFPQGLEGDKFHYAASGIDVRGSYDDSTRTLTYIVTEGNNVVTRSDYLSHSGYRMIHGINYKQNLFVVSYRL